MNELAVKEEKKVLKPLAKTLPKRELHNTYGICFDKINTYTVKEINSSELNGSITINRILGATDTSLSEDKQTVIVFKFSMRGEDECRNVGHFAVTSEKKISSVFGGDYSYSKKDVMENLKESVQIAVIQTDEKSLKYPKYTYKNIGNILSNKFNDDRTLYDRVVFTDKYTERYSDEQQTFIKVPITREEIVSNYTNCDVNVMNVNTGVKFRLHKTIGTLGYEKWSEMIDKSGYNLNIARISLDWRLEDYKAKKVKQLIKCGHNIILETEIIKEIAVCKRLIGELLTVIHVDNLNIVDDYLDRMKHEYRNLKETQETIKKVGTDREYKPYTVTV